MAVLDILPSAIEPQLFHTRFQPPLDDRIAHAFHPETDKPSEATGVLLIGEQDASVNGTKYK